MGVDGQEFLRSLSELLKLRELDLDSAPAELASALQALKTFCTVSSSDLTAHNLAQELW